MLVENGEGGTVVNLTPVETPRLRCFLEKYTSPPAENLPLRPLSMASSSSILLLSTSSAVSPSPPGDLSTDSPIGLSAASDSPKLYNPLKPNIPSVTEYEYSVEYLPVSLWRVTMKFPGGGVGIAVVEGGAEPLPEADIGPLPVDPLPEVGATGRGGMAG